MRALKELQYLGTNSSIKTLKKYRDEVDDIELAEMADRVIDEINKRACK